MYHNRSILEKPEDDVLEYEPDEPAFEPSQPGTVGDEFRETPRDFRDTKMQDARYIYRHCHTRSASRRAQESMLCARNSFVLYALNIFNFQIQASTIRHGLASNGMKSKLLRVELKPRKTYKN